jgi:hypothetical protein
LGGKIGLRGDFRRNREASFIIFLFFFPTFKRVYERRKEKGKKGGKGEGKKAAAIPVHFDS